MLRRDVCSLLLYLLGLPVYLYILVLQTVKTTVRRVLYY